MRLVGSEGRSSWGDQGVNESPRHAVTDASERRRGAALRPSSGRQDASPQAVPVRRRPRWGGGGIFAGVCSSESEVAVGPKLPRPRSRTPAPWGVTLCPFHLSLERNLVSLLLF